MKKKPQATKPKVKITGSASASPSRALKPQPFPKVMFGMNQLAQPKNNQTAPKGVSDMTKSPVDVLKKIKKVSKPRPKK
jgi:hypothetical protein